MKTAYLTQVPGGVWRCTETGDISLQDLRNKMLSVLDPETRVEIITKLKSFGVNRLSSLEPYQYKTFYKFLLTLE